MGEHWQMNHLSPLLVILPGSRKEDSSLEHCPLFTRGSSHLCPLLTRGDKIFILMANQGINRWIVTVDSDPAQWMAWPWPWPWVSSFKWIELSSASKSICWAREHLLTDSTGKHQLKERPKTKIQALIETHYGRVVSVLVQEMDARSPSSDSRLSKITSMSVA